MDWVSIVIVAVAGLLTWRAFRRGFLRELVGLGALILAVPVAGVFYDDMAPKVEPIVDNATGAALLSFVAILLGVIVGGQLLGYFLRRGVDALNLGGADRLAGAAFGLLQGLLLCQVLLIALVIFPSPDLRVAIEDSVLAGRLLEIAPLALSVLPDGFRETIDQFLRGIEFIEEGLETLDDLNEITR